jgi:16S rRNA (cytosine1402-N4)-methyltransferase
MHTPVLLKEVIENLKPKKGEIILDATFGNGGHSKEILKIIGDSGKIIGLDQDKEILKKTRLREATARQAKNLILVNENFRNLDTVLDSLKIEKVNGVLLDIGINSDQLEKSGRGFSFQKDEPLLMNMGDPSMGSGQAAQEIVNQWPEKLIADLLYKYGEEKFSRSIARKIVAYREKKKIDTTFELVDIIRSSVPAGYRNGRINCATKTFQALRIAVNDELNALEEGLAKAWERLDKDGRLAVISFHSLEDRIVKNFFKDKKQKEEGILINKKPIIASDEEKNLNPRSRSAKLRIIEKIK